MERCLAGKTYCHVDREITKHSGLDFEWRRSHCLQRPNGSKRLGHVFGMTFIVKQDVASNPLHIGFFDAIGIVFNAKGISHLVE